MMCISDTAGHSEKQKDNCVMLILWNFCIYEGPYQDNSDDHVRHYNEKAGPNNESESEIMISYLKILSKYVKGEKVPKYLVPSI